MNNKAGWGIGVIGLLLVLGIMCRGALVDESTAVRALETQGFTEVKVLHHAFLFMGFRGGDRSDAARFTCEATNPAGRRVTVYVFVGWPFKGATIRTL